MKKIMIFIFMLIYLFSIKNVFAQDQYKLTLQKVDGIYFSRKGSNFEDDSYPYYLYKFGDIYAYCMQPGKHFKTYDYVGINNYVDLPFSSELMEKLELIGHFGRDYPNHDNIRYSMATQALIWELTGVDKVSFWTKQYEQGEEIDVTNEKNEIMRLVNKAKLSPNISKNIIGIVNREITINDSNNVLSDYEIENNSNNDITISGNTLKIIPKEIGNVTFKLKYKKYDDLKTIIFVGKDNSDSQILGRLRFSQNKDMEINLSVNGVRLLVNKVDENNKKLNIAGIRFKIKDLNNNQYLCENTCEYVTNENGSFITKALPYGEYEIEELENQFVPGYIWNNKKLKININENGTFKLKDNYYYIETNFTNHSYQENVVLYKKGQRPVFKDNKITYEENWIGNFEFEVYHNDGTLLKVAKTNNDGKVSVLNVAIGKYYFIEKTRLNNYIPNTEKHYFTIKQDSQYGVNTRTVFYVKNYLKKGTLEFIKKDKKTGVGISDTVIEIYSNNNELLLTRTTDNDGRITISDLPYGKYYIKEKEANINYQKSDEVLFFEIKEDKEFVKVEMFNEKIHGLLELNKYGEELIINDNKNSYQKKPLSNVEFNLYNEEDELINTLVTDNNGYFKEELELGKYYLKENSRLNNYQENSEKYYFEIKNNNDNNVKISVDNYLKKGKLVFIKEDYYTGVGIDDTLIEIYNEKNELLITQKTNKDGKIIVDNLEYGKYCIIEKTANYFYQKEDEKKCFEIKENGEIVKVKMTNKKIVGNLEIVKMGEKYQIIDNNFYYDKDVLLNIEFSIYSDNNEFIGNIKTDKNGHAKYFSLPLGKYYLIEKTRLKNYIVNSDKIYFEIKKDGNNGVDVKLEIDNYLRKGNLEFIKKDLVTSEGIPNTIIEIYDTKNNLLMTKETNENGEISIHNLPCGKYYIIEKEANSMYQITNEKVYFEIKENGEIVKAQMTNEKKTIKVPKTKTKESIIANSLFSIGFLIGMGRFYYERKKTS